VRRTTNTELILGVVVMTGVGLFFLIQSGGSHWMGWLALVLAGFIAVRLYFSTRPPEA
jgi:hypothetical protein